MIIGSERLDAFCRALDNFLDDERDGEGKAVDLVCELANKVGVPTSSIWHVFHAWTTTKQRRVLNPIGRTIIDFSCGMFPTEALGIGLVLKFWDVDEFLYSCPAGAAQVACYFIQGNDFRIDRVCRVVATTRSYPERETDYAFHFRDIHKIKRKHRFLHKMRCFALQKGLCIV